MLPGSALLRDLSFLVCLHPGHLMDEIYLFFLRLDISDSGRFFAAAVPVRGIDEPSLRYAMAALSAKHLARMKGVKLACVAGLFTSPATMEAYPNTEQVDWPLKAANYYYLAVTHLNSSISDYAAVSTSDVLEPPISIVNRWLNLQLRQAQRQLETSDATWKTAENLLASSTILTLYKILDEPGDNWQSYGIPSSVIVFKALILYLGIFLGSNRFSSSCLICLPRAVEITAAFLLASRPLSGTLPEWII